MAEILIRAVNNGDVENKQAYKIGMPVVIMQDNHLWGSKESPPNFYLLKVPFISVDKVLKFIKPQMVTIADEEIIYRRRLWKIRVKDLPTVVKQKFKDNGELIIKATDTYTGEYDYTWTQIKNYFRNLQTGLDGVEID